MVGVLANDYRVLSGTNNVSVYEAPILRGPPLYHSYFCSKCGSPLPPVKPSGWFEIPAGLFDDDPKVRPDKQIFIELVPPWDSITDGLPNFTLRDLVRSRHNEELPEDHELITHHGRVIKI